MNKLLLFFCLGIYGGVFPQALIPSETYVRTCISDIECSSIGGASHFIYDEANEQLYLRIDFASMRTGLDTVDFWLNELAAAYFYFKGNLPKSKLLELGKYSAETVRIEGQMSLNHVWKNKSLSFTFLKLEDQGKSNSPEGNMYDQFRVNLSFSFSPREFNIHKKPGRLSSTVFIGITGGSINIFKPGMESLLGEAFEKK